MGHTTQPLKKKFVDNSQKSSHLLDFQSTLMSKSLIMKRSDDFILSKIRRTSLDVNKPDIYGLLPLHLAIDRSSTTVAHELIKLGADINALDSCQYYTPLHIAVISGNLEAVCMLLFYGADVTIPNKRNMTPLMIALKLGNREIAIALVDYYDDFSCTSTSDETALDFAVWSKSSLAVDLIKRGADFNLCVDKVALIIRSLDYDSDELFRLIWPKDSKILLNISRPFVSTYLRRCKFPTSQWADCLNLILCSSTSFALVQQQNNLIFDFLAMCSKRKVQKVDRTALLYLFMGLGATTHVLDLDFALELYGFREETVALIYTSSFAQDNTTLTKEISSPVHVQILTNRNIDRTVVFDLFKNQIRSGCSPNEVVRDLKYFSVPAHVKKELIDLSKRYYDADHQLFCDELSRIPDVPSLLEISRNEVRRLVGCKVGKLYQLHDAVRDLDLPKVLKDVVLFKRPIY